MTVITPYAYPNGQELDPDGHNENVYSKNAGKGIQSEVNGGLNSFKTSFEVQKEHVWPEEAVRIRQDAALETLDVFSDAHADSGSVVYRPVAGCSTKIYVPSAATLALWEWSVFISEARFFVHYRDRLLNDDGDYVPGSEEVLDPTMVIRARLIDSAGTVTNMPHSKRLLPHSVGHYDRQYDRTVVASTFRARQVFEDRSSLHFGMHHLQEDVVAGWHELVLTLHQEQVTQQDDDTDRSIYQDMVERTTGETSVKTMHVFYQRASFGIRNARVLTLL